MKLLVDAFNPAAAAGLMCRDTLSVGWDGRCVACGAGGLAGGVANGGPAAALPSSPTQRLIVSSIHSPFAMPPQAL